MDRERIEERIRELLLIIEKELEKCPWISTLPSNEMVKELREEVEEVEEALNGEGNVEEEVGDVVRDALLLLAIVAKERGKGGDEFLERSLRKIRWRKPWLWEEKKISKEEAVRIWDERKKAEKAKEGKDSPG